MSRLKELETKFKNDSNKLANNDKLTWKEMSVMYYDLYIYCKENDEINLNLNQLDTYSSKLSCFNKKRIPTEELAKTKANEREMRYYFCDCCGGFHLTKQPLDTCQFCRKETRCQKTTDPLSVKSYNDDTVYVICDNCLKERDKLPENPIIRS